MRKKGTLYTVNKWNQPLFGSKENLFVIGGNTAYNPNMYGVLSNNYSNSTNNNYFGTQTQLQQPTFRYQYGYRSNSPEINHLSYNLDYNKGFGYNSNVFGSNQSNNSLHLNTNLKLDNVASTSSAPQDSTTNIESSGQGVNWGGMGAGIASIIPENEMTIGNKTFKRGAWDALDPVYYAADGRESEAGDTLSNLGVKVTKASLASGQWWGALAGAGLKIAGGIDNAVAGTKTDTDSLNAANKGIYMRSNYYSGASLFDDLQAPTTFYGNTDVYEGPSKSAENWAGGIGTVAGMLTGIPGLGTLFGKAYKKRSQKAREEAEKKNRELKEKQEFANQWATNSYINNINNIKQDQYNRALANFSAYGGPLEQMAMNNQGMAAIDYGFMTDYLAAKNQQNQQKTNMTNMFAGTAPTMFAEGGGIHIKPSHKGLFTAKAKRAGMGVQAFASHVLANKEDYPASTRKQAAFAKAASGWKHAEGGPLVNMAAMETPMPVIDSALYANGGKLASQSDFTDGLVQVNAGGTHEMNPNDGVQMGVDNQMNPNLVEEGETVFDDYVYSNRIFVDDDTKKRYGINKKKKITYAELSKKLEKEASERQNDPISQAGLKASMADLADAQEAEKMRIEAEKAKAAFDSLTPEEQTMIMANNIQQGNINTYGGNLFQDGGNKEQYQQQRERRSFEALTWILNNPKIANILKDEEAIDKVVDMMVSNYYDHQGQYNWSPEKAFKKIVPTKIFNKDNVNKFVGNYQKAGLDLDTSIALATMFVPDSVNTKVFQNQIEDVRKEYTEKENQQPVAEVTKQIEQPKANKENTRTSVWQNMQAAMGAPNNNTAPTTVQRIANTPLYNSYYANPDSSVVKPQVVEEIVEQAPSATPVVETVAATVPPVQQPIVNQAPATVANNGRNYYDYYRNGNRGYGEAPTGFLVNDKGKASNYTNQYRDFVDNQLTLDSVRDWIENHPDDTSLKSYLANHSLDDLSLNDVRKGATDGVYGWMHNAADELWQRYNALPVEQKISVPQPSREPITNINVASTNTTPSRDTQVYIIGDNGLQAVNASDLDDSYTIEDFDGVKLARKSVQNPANSAVTTKEGEGEGEDVEPRHRAEWPRYAGLFGPAVGLGMMAAGVGKPDYSNLDAALEIASSGPRLASYQTLGDYLTYRPMDIWAEQNRLDANTRAADRAIMNGNNPARYAALLANNYNAQLASGDLYRKALEYNDAKRAQVAEFNRGTNQYNADAYTRNSQFNADAINRANQYKAGLAAQIASQKLGYDNDWYGSMYANVGNLFQGLSDLGRENALWNMVSKTAADTTNLGDSYTGDIYLKKGKKGSKNKNDLKL